jgi:P4 family phage/plasmid primase-like protien
MSYKEILINEIAEQLGMEQKKKTGSDTMYHCFAHDDSTPSLSLNDEKNVFHCFGCGIDGNSIELIKKYLKVEAKEAFEWLNQHFPETTNLKPTKLKKLLPVKQKREYKIRYINANKDFRYGFLAEDELQMQEATDEDISKIKNILCKSYSKETLQRAGAYINHSHITNKNGIRYSGYGIVLKVDKYNSVCYNPEKLHYILHLEGMTDYLTAIELGLYEWFALVSDHSKAAIAPVEYGDQLFIMDEDNSPETIKNQLLKTIKAPINAKFVRLPDGTKDLSDFAANGGSSAQLLEIIESTNSEFLIPEKKENSAGNVRLSIKEIQEYIHDSKDKPVYDRVVDMILKHFEIKCHPDGRSYQFYIYKNGFYNPIYKEQILNLIYDWIIPEKRTANLLDNIIKLLRAKPGVFIDQELLNTEKLLTNLDNCSYNMENNIPYPHSSNNYFTYKHDFGYNPNAQCPEFDKALWEYSMHDQIWIDLFWEIAGYVQTVDMPIQKMFWFVGAQGRNGKGTVIRILENLVGSVYTAPDIKLKQLDEKFYLNQLYKKRLATAGDLPPRLVNASTIKQLTGADKVVSDIKYGNPITFTNNAKLVFAMNQLPVLPRNERVEPILKRAVILPFEYVIKEPDTNVEEKFMQELSGIFNKSMEGLKRLRKNKKFTELPRAKRYFDMITNREEIHETFFYMKLKADANNSVFLYRIWDEYRKWMGEQHSGDSWKNDKTIAVRNSRSLSTKLIEYYQAKGIYVTKSERYCNVRHGKQTFIEGIDITSNDNEEDQF